MNCSTETFTESECAQLLKTVCNFKSLRGLSLADSLVAAQSKHKEFHAIYVLNALDRRSEKSFCEAKAALLRCELAIAVIEAGIAHEAEKRAAQVEEKAAKKEKLARCAHFKTIKAAYQCARERGLNVKDCEGMRRFCSRVLGREIESRSSMSGRDWNLVVLAIKDGATW